MNANELADSLEAASSDMEYNFHVSDWKLLYECALVMRKQQAEIEALTELNTMLKDAIEKRIGMDAERYKWLRTEFAAGRETYLAEGIPSGETLDKYIDGKLNK